MEELTPFNKRVVAIVGDTALTGVVGAHEDDTDHPQGKNAKLKCWQNSLPKLSQHFGQYLNICIKQRYGTVVTTKKWVFVLF